MMVFLQLAWICLPPQFRGVDLLNKKVHFIVCMVVVMGVPTLVVHLLLKFILPLDLRLHLDVWVFFWSNNLLSFLLGLCLNHFSLFWLFNLCNFLGRIRNSFSLELSFLLLSNGDLGFTLDIKVIVHLSIEALNWMLRHRATAILLDKTDHGFVTNRVKTSIITSVKISQHQVLVLVWVLSEWGLGVVPEIGDESLTILKLNHERLIINSAPASLNLLSSFKSSCCLVSFIDGYLDLAFFSKVDIVWLGQDLQPIWQVVCTDVLRIKQVNVCLLFADKESPLSIDIATHAVNWLVRLGSCQ
jgi:hypothetical protein